MPEHALQLQILERLSREYPMGELEFADLPGDNDQAKRETLLHLGEHGLCRFDIVESVHGESMLSRLHITPKGLEFLAEDGGLAGILGADTVKLDGKTVRDMLVRKVDESELPATEKTALKHALATMSDTSMKEAVTRLVEAGLGHMPDVVENIRVWVGA